jgi:hypothetical protein
MALYLYIFLAFLIVAVEFRRRRASLPVDALTAFNCYYLVLYALVPINVLCFGEDVVRQKYAYETFGEGDQYTALALIVTYIAFCLGYWMKSEKKSSAPHQPRTSFYSLQSSASVAVIIFWLGVLITVVYVVQLGGISQVITMAMDVRSGEYTIESKYIFYRHFAQFSADAFSLFFAVLIGKKIKGMAISFREKIFLFCTFLFYVYYAASTGGRRPFIYPIILCYLVSMSVGMRVKKWAVVAFALVFILAGLGSLISVVGSVNNLTGLVEIATTNENASWPALLELAYVNSTQGLADSFIHFVGAQAASLWQFGFLRDIRDFPKDFFPSRLFGFKRTRGMDGEVSEYFQGRPLEEDVSGEDNLGLHGYLLVNFGYVGMSIAFFLLGMLYRWLDIRLRPSELQDAVGWLVYWWFVLAFFIYFREGVLMFVIKLQITWWVTIFLLRHFQPKQQESFGSSPAAAPV